MLAYGLHSLKEFLISINRQSRELPSSYLAIEVLL
jgi:hypothetical protein